MSERIPSDSVVGKMMDSDAKEALEALESICQQSNVVFESTSPKLVEPVSADPIVAIGPDTGIDESAVEAVIENKHKKKKLEAKAAREKAMEALASNGFAALGLNDQLLQAIGKSGYDAPTPIQTEIIPHMLAGKDVLAQSQTGTGKTAAFALPVLSRIDPGLRQPQVLVLAPTRELAMQVAASFTTYASCMKGLEVISIYGGSDYDAQFRQLRRGPQIVVGTPGRVIDHVNRGTLDLGGIQCLVLDEADEMLNMGFLEDVEFVLARTPATRQVALFSATLPPPIREMSKKYLNDPARITIQNRTMTAANIRQRALVVAPRDRIEVLTRMLEVESSDGVIIFTQTREASVNVAAKLTEAGLSAIAINGDMQQRVRERTIEGFKAGRTNILVATDVAARGLDVSRVSHVFNFDLPNDPQSYVHRIGRTGRAGRSGEAVIFMTHSQRGKLRHIERVTNQPVEMVNPPTAREVNTLRLEKFKQRIIETAATADLKVFREMVTSLSEETGTPMETIAAALVAIGQQHRPLPVADKSQENFRDSDDRGSFHRDRNERRGRFDRDGHSPRDRSNGRGTFERKDFDRKGDSEMAPLQPGMQRYRIEVGWRDGARPNNIVGAVANEAGIEGGYIGPIRILDSYSMIDLPEGLPADIHETLQHTRVAGKPLRISDPLSAEPETFGRRKKAFGGARRSMEGKPRHSKSKPKLKQKPKAKVRLVKGPLAERLKNKPSDSDRS